MAFYYMSNIYNDNVNGKKKNSVNEDYGVITFRYAPTSEYEMK